VTRRLNHRLVKVERRLHLLEGLRIAYLNLDEVIRIVRQEEEPKQVLMSRFRLSEEQTDYILETRLRQLIKDELRHDAEKFGDDRRSPLIERSVAQALDESALVASEPVTVVLSQKGWARAAKGHDIDAEGLSYREGDSLLAAVKARTTQQVAFIDSTGRAYSTATHTLPSARGNGEPLTGRFSPPTGASFDAVVAGDNDTRLILATDFGYGFVTRFEALTGRNKAGKQIISLSDGARVLAPVVSLDPARDRIVVVTTEGHLLMFSVAELPELDKGKGNKLIEIPKAKLGSGEERVAGVAVVTESKGEVTLFAGQRKLTLKWNDLVEYGGNRATRGGVLPRGLRRVERIETTG
jgi:topoisomerase-4 subunit A